MTVHDPGTGKARKVGRFLWHYTEMVIAMIFGMLVLGLVWSAVLPGVTRTDAQVLIMATDMSIGMAVWMRVRRHGWPSIAEMSLAMFAPFLVLLVPYWLGALPGHLVMSLGHVLMLVCMALAMLRRREEYTGHRHRLRSPWVRAAAVVLVALVIPLPFGALNAAGKYSDRYEPRADRAAAVPVSKAHDPAKPTVAFLVGSAGAQVADLFGPYEVLAGSGLLNTYIVSPSRQLTPLTGGLDLVPDLTFDELARLLADQHDSLDAVVVPALQRTDQPETAAIGEWLRRQSQGGALTVSVCAGARVLAEAGLLDDRPATSHWWRLPAFSEEFDKVKWVSGQRYVDDGNVITTAGVLSGIDGGLRVIERLFDVPAAHEAARKLHWRYYSPGISAPIPKSGWDAPDAVVVLNAAFQPGPSTIGVQLTDGVSELELASAFTTYTDQAMIGRTIAVGDGAIRSKHGLTFVPRSTVAAVAGDLDRLLVPGLDAARRHAVSATGGLQPEYLHLDEEFAFDPVLRDIARTYDVQTARWTAKALEYPAIDVELTGSSWPWLATIIPVLLALLGAAVAIAIGMVFRRMRARSRQGTEQAAGALTPAQPNAF